MRNLQDVFNIVWERAKNPIRASIIDNVGNVECTYRDKDGLACFLGACISDEDYTPDIEGLNPFSLSDIKYADLYKNSFGECKQGDLRDLQGIHDQDSLKDWNQHLTKFAKKHSLQIPE
jgi:hypothetical protein